MNKEIINENLHFISFKRLDNNNVINLFTYKPYNFRKTIVSSEEIQSNYLNIQKDLKQKINKIVCPIQTHTNVVKVVNEDTINDEFNNVDGLITNIKDVALTTVVADCQAILLYDQDKQVIGNIHSGWKGTLNRIIENAVNLMKEEFKCNPKNIQAYICPSILKCCFEVDEDVKDLFVENFQDININACIELGEIKDNKQKYYIDTVLVNKMVMKNLGLLEENIISSNICTKCHNNLMHSYRSEGASSGRNLALICLK